MPTSTDKQPQLKSSDKPAAVPAPKSLIGFSTEENSPFTDGYSITGEEALLAAYMAGPMREDDPLYERYIELEDRKDQLARMQAKFHTRKGSDPDVKPAEFFALVEESC